MDAVIIISQHNKTLHPHNTKKSPGKTFLPFRNGLLFPRPRGPLLNKASRISRGRGRNLAGFFDGRLPLKTSFMSSWCWRFCFMGGGGRSKVQYYLHSESKNMFWCVFSHGKKLEHAVFVREAQKVNQPKRQPPDLLFELPPCHTLASRQRFTKTNISLFFLHGWIGLYLTNSIWKNGNFHLSPTISGNVTIANPNTSLFQGQSIPDCHTVFALFDPPNMIPSLSE